MIYEYVDRGVSVLARMFGKRLRGYRRLGYEVGCSYGSGAYLGHIVTA